MRWIILLLLAGQLLAREPLFEFSLEVSSQVSGQGTNQCQDILSAGDRARDLGEEITGKLGPQTTLLDIIGVLKTFSSLEGLPTSEVYLFKQKGQVAATVKGLVRPESMLRIWAGAFQTTSVTPRVRLDGLLGYNLSDHWGQDWLDDLDAAIGQGIPSSLDPRVIAWADRLQEVGYPDKLAMALAVIAARGGIDFDGDTGEILFDALTNTLLNQGRSFEDLDLEENTSGLRFRSLRFREVGVSFDFPVLPWLYIGASARLLEASTSTWFRRFDQSNVQTLYLLGQSFVDTWTTNPENVSRNFSVSASVTARPIDGLSITLSGTNLNSPAFVWPSWRARLEAQGNLALRWDFWGPVYPLSIVLSTDLNSIREPTAPWVRHGHLVVGLVIEPQVYWGFGGGLLWKLDWGFHGPSELEARLSFWYGPLHLGFTASSGWDVLHFSGNILPTSWSASCRLGLKVRW